MNFAALIPDHVMTETLGDDATYHALHGNIAIKVMISDSLLPDYAGQSFYSEKRKIIDAAFNDLPGVTKGSLFTIGGVRYTVDAVLDNDGFFIKMAVI